MLTELCEYLRNWFCEDQDKHIGQVTITDGEITVRDDLDYMGKEIEPQDGQYFRVVGSVFNDGIHKYGDQEDALTDETFYGALWLLKIPAVIVSLAADIAVWKQKYGGADSKARSPYDSESFAGYSYSKSSGGSGSGSDLYGWHKAFADSLTPWRKI